MYDIGLVKGQDESRSTHPRPNIKDLLAIDLLAQRLKKAVVFFSSRTIKYFGAQNTSR
jgi:hypothetical protein